MSLFVTARPFFKLSIAGISASLLFTTGTVSKIQADDLGLHDIAFTFDLEKKDHASNSDGGKSSHDSFDFSLDKKGDLFAFGGDAHDFGVWDKGRDHSDFFVFTSKDKDRHHNSSGQDSGNCWSDPTCGDGNHGGSTCGGDPSGGGTPAVPEPGSTYLSFIAASAMALLLLRRNIQQHTAAKRG